MIICIYTGLLTPAMEPIYFLFISLYTDERIEEVVGNLKAAVCLLSLAVIFGQLYECVARYISQLKSIELYPNATVAVRDVRWDLSNAVFDQ